MNTGTKGDFKEAIFSEVNENVRALERLFPSAVKDGQVDFEALKEELGVFEEVGPEKYELTWSGKKNAKKASQQDIVAKTLKYIPEDSVNPETTENLYIEGDNLEVLKLLRQNYYGAIKMIYIDPPYNTGNDFVYNDNFSMDKKESDILEGDISDLGERYTVNSKSSNKYHANWLNMMYPRLRIAKDLLKDDGIIYISIDSNEMENLQRICNEVFGEENLISNIIWVNNERGRSIDRFISNTNEYILMYAKNINSANVNQRRETGEDILKEYSLKDGKSYYKKGDPLFNNNSKFNIDTRPNLVYSIYINKNTNEKRCIDEKYKDSNGNWILPLENKMGEEWIKVVPPLRNTNNKIGCWRWGIPKFLEENESELMLIEERSGKFMFYSKNRLDVNNAKWFKYKNIINSISSSQGTSELVKLLDGKYFEHPKPIKLIELLVEQATSNDSIILDFFSGSCTTAHAIFINNLKDNGRRKFIAVQLPEKVEYKSEAYKAGYKNICEIGKERIRRAGKKIKEENKDKEGIEDLDIGFKVFRVADTNIRWIRESEELRTLASEITSKEKIQQTTFNYIAATSSKVALDEVVSPKDRLDFMPGFKDIDVVYELLLRQRDIPLSAKVRQLEDIGIRTYLFDESFLVCLEEDITNELVEKLASINPLPIKFILRDSAFGDDINLKDETNRRLKTLIERNTGETKKTYTVEYI